MVLTLGYADPDDLLCGRASQARLATEVASRQAGRHEEGEATEATEPKEGEEDAGEDPRAEGVGVDIEPTEAQHEGHARLTVSP